MLRARFKIKYKEININDFVRFFSKRKTLGNEGAYKEVGLKQLIK